MRLESSVSWVIYARRHNTWCQEHELILQENTQRSLSLSYVTNSCSELIVKNAAQKFVAPDSNKSCYNIVCVLMVSNINVTWCPKKPVIKLYEASAGHWPKSFSLGTAWYILPSELMKTFYRHLISSIIWYFLIT